MLVHLNIQQITHDVNNNNNNNLCIEVTVFFFSP